MPLKREVGFLHVFAVGTGAMISSGLFVLPAVLHGQVGSGAFLCYLGAAVLLLPALLSTAELMTAMPKAGGDYFFIDRSLGPGFGTVGGVAAWASLSFKTAFALLGIGALSAFVWGWDMSGWQVKAVASAACLLFTVVNIMGIKLVGRIQLFLVVVLLGVLAAYLFRGVGSVTAGRYRPLFPHGWQSVLTGIAMVFVAFGGVTKVATMGEEVREPKKNLVRGLFAASAVVAFLYVTVVFVTTGLLPAGSEQWSFAPLAQAAGTFWGRAGAVLLGAAGLFAFLTTGNAGILAASRTLMAMSQDELVPARLGKISRRSGTPVYAVVSTSAFMLAIILVLNLEMFVRAASAMKIMLFMFVILSLILMRESRIPTYRPTWRSPLYPWLHVFGMAAYAFLLVEVGTLALAIAGAIMGGALVWYFLYAKVSVLRESALIRLAARIARPDFKDHDLETELSKVARQHDTRTDDRFDRLIQNCTVLDLRGPTGRQEAFRGIAETLAGEIHLPAERVYDLLLQREDISPTVIRPGLAIPHLILEGLDSFVVILVRSRDGVVFAEGQPPVHAIFVLVAPPEDRNFYLKALVAIAEIAQDPEFDARWAAASSREALREIVLGAERRREENATTNPPPEATG